MSLRLNRLSAPKNGRWLLLTVGLALAAATLLFLPFIIYQGGVFYYYGDFNVQEIPFYQLIHGQVRDGTLGWNHLTDLGTDTLASYSFYLLGSPFFWLTVPFPNEVVPNLIGPLLILNPPFLVHLVESLTGNTPFPAFEQAAMAAYWARVAEYSDPRRGFTY